MHNPLLLLSLIAIGFWLPAPKAIAEGAELGREGATLKSENAAPTRSALAWLIPPWGKYRDRLEHAGARFWITYTSDNLGNASGGRATAFRYASSLETGLALDLEKLVTMRGLAFTLSGDYRAGRDLSREIGSALAPAEIFAGDAMRLYQLSLEQFLLDDRLSVLAGRIGMGDEFFTSALYTNYVQSAFNNNPGSLDFNVPSFSVGPVSTWGWRVRFEYESAYIMSGIYYADDTIGADQEHGVDFSIRSDKGFISVLQIGYKHNQEKNAEGLPGSIAVGSFYDSNEYGELGDSTDGRYGNYGIYFHAEQMLYAEPHAPRQQGLTAFLAAMVAPRTEINTLPYFYLGGLVYGGLFPGRDHDTTSLGVAYGQFSSRLEGTYETAFEINHEFQIMPGLSLQPDLQYILRPGGTGDIPDAVVLGFELKISL